MKICLIEFSSMNLYGIIRFVVVASLTVTSCNSLAVGILEPNYYYTNFPPVQRPMPTWGCIECTYANRVNCCRYFQRCCTTANFPSLGSCQASEIVPQCSQQCNSDGQCPSGQKCCPTSPFVCLIPFGLNECPLTVSSTAIVRPCSSPGGCFNNEFCCPDPRTPGCCVTRMNTGPFPQNSLNPG